MTLALLLTAATGAMAITDPNSDYWDNLTWKGWADSETTHTVGDITITCSGNAKAYESTTSGEPLAMEAGNNDAITFTSNGKPFASVAIMTGDDLNVAGWTYNSSTCSYEWSGEPTTSVTLSGCDIKADVITFTFAAEAPITVAWNASTKTGTFTQPASDVVLTPIYAAATVYGADGQTEKQAYETLKEALANVQDGDVIKLDWNVTLTEALETPTTQGGVKFTLDFNGYTLDFGATYQIKLKNAGDQLTFTDSSVDQLGGLIAETFNVESGKEFVFDAGRYNLGEATAEQINAFCADTRIPFSLAEGKEFVDIEGAPVNGFMVRVDYKAIELTIGAGKFATFYAEEDFKVVEGTSIGLYTIMTSGIDLANNQITTTPLNGSIIGGETPVLIYNGGSAQQTVKLQVTTETAASQMHASAFQGTDAGKTFEDTDMAANDYYVLSGGSAFAPVKGKGTIAAHKCWLEFAKQEIPSARQLTIVFDSEATGIRSMDNGQLIMDNWYDLNGRKLNAKPTRKGVYIKNGQKVVK